ncbi:hypothetical protein JAO76_16120 [Pontibacter sp. BT310]|uniref:Uncharacterized protein n=1 Tax=Pontibacter populi TaxID=890055 RepID=A0ABS6XFA6_9BACT|nr:MULTISPECIES: hypothetical protein [Pontibacter]MBJ6119734.1 hypothetical protein [Pontibacter sp. BT310]MBR0572163.1 hypothetical protein [Microvirga sp. STS03]MBW3366587.1 hypothetical protein [Pontibacter populi]
MEIAKERSVAGIKEKDESKTLQGKKLRMETFTYIPEEYYGCGCSLFLTEQDEKADIHIYRDAGDIAMIVLNGKIHRMEYKGELNGVTTYSNDSIKVERVHAKAIESTEMEETVDVEGVLTITKGKDKLEKKYIGYCGC